MQPLFAETAGVEGSAGVLVMLLGLNHRDSSEVTPEFHVKASDIP